MNRKVTEDLSTQEEDEKSAFSGSSNQDAKDGTTGTNDSGERPGDQSHTGSDECSNSDATLAFGKKENLRVQKSKILVLAIFFLFAVAACFTVYYVINKNETNEFNEAYQESAETIIVSFREVLEVNIASIASLGVTFTASSQSENRSWPFVTMNDFQQRCASTKSVSKALLLELFPIVSEVDRYIWETYSVVNQGWISEGQEFQDRFGLGNNQGLLPPTETKLVAGNTHPASDQQGLNISDRIFTFDASRENRVVDAGPGPYYPRWQSSPILPRHHDMVNYNLARNVDQGPSMQLAASTGQITIAGFDITTEGNDDFESSLIAQLLSYSAGQLVHYTGDPFSSVYIPVADSFDDDRKIVAILGSVIHWQTYFNSSLPSNSEAVIVVLENTCDGQFSYIVSGDGAEYLGPGNHGNEKYSSMVIRAGIDDDSFTADPTTVNLTLNQDGCEYYISVYPSEEMDESYNTINPFLITCVMASVFIAAVGVFLIYDLMVEQRQQVVMSTAQRSTAIVSSIFPKQVVGRLMSTPLQGNATKLRSLIHHNDMEQNRNGTAADIGMAPIADLFPEATVMFADVQGFTAWSSIREPSQVFILLENLYNAFDHVASRRRVFKVETVGDCYVAVCGLPDPMPHHAVVMARFARDCIAENAKVTKELEVLLGPDTGDLKIRIGLHSGPITAGVLRGQKSRFQLFGDTVNTCARLESSGEGNAIHISKETASLLIDAGKQSWIQAREDAVELKGKGCLKTYWLVNKTSPVTLAADSSSEGTGPDGKPSSAVQIDDLDDKTKRLIDWNADLLLRMAREIVARRQAQPERKRTSKTGGNPAGSAASKNGNSAKETTPLDEVVEIIHLPEFHSGIPYDVQQVELDPDVAQQIRDYVETIAIMYRQNAFHNFEHASHVCMSVAKLLSRIRAPSDMNYSNALDAKSKLHDHTYGITSDPLTQFACVLSALVHDVDHQGVPNSQLVKEEDIIAGCYKGKSVAEQHSVELAWDLFMESKFDKFRATLCSDSEELTRFRQLVVNSVLATDIMDKDLKALRNARWEKAFSSDHKESEKDSIDRKATIVIEHLIQASDISHTMQHWTVYRRWNARLFTEMYEAYKNGRSDKDPSDFWYEGEIGFFDFYIIPLARKLKNCGVFGVSSDEYIQYAISNRNEWEQQGRAVVAELVASVKDKE